MLAVLLITTLAAVPEGTFTTTVATSPDMGGGHPRYIPYSGAPPQPGWENPLQPGGCAGACHEMPAITTSPPMPPVFATPPMPPECARPSTTDPRNCYGTP